MNNQNFSSSSFSYLLTLTKSLALVGTFLSCSSTPSIVTHHKTIPNKKTETISGKSNSNIASHKKNNLPANASPVANENFTLDSQKENQIEFKNLTTTHPVSTGVINNSSATTSASTSTLQINLNNQASAIPATSILTPVQAVERTSEVIPVESQKIGVILPITGKNSTLGQRALNSLRLGLGLLDGSSKINLVIFDSQGLPELAAKGAEKLVKEDHVISLVGGLSSKEAQSIAQKAEFLKTPYFSFSQKSGITNNAEYVFRNAITSEMQVEKLVLYATQKLGAKKFAVLFPNDAYGVEFANKYWDLVLAAGGEITAAQSYNPEDTNLDQYIQKLVGTYYVDARIDEYKQRMRELALKNKKKTEDPNYKKNTREKEAKENVLTSIADFDVLFVPDTSKSLGQVVAFMKNNDVDKMIYLGTNLWNTNDLGRRVGPLNDSIFFVDSTVNDQLVEKSDFHKKYQQQFNEEPSIVEAQAFEVAKIFKELLSKNFTSRDSLNDELKILGERQGAYETIRMNNTHEIERQLYIFGLHENKPTFVE